MKKIIQHLAAEDSSGSVAVRDRIIIESFIANPDHTFLVSFPRTGSHWLRMLMELYFERPSLVRVFYYPESQNYLTLHTHDEDLEVERKHVIYLYRDPVDTIYSQLCYYKESLGDRERISYWADQYGLHLDKWLYQEQFTQRKTILSYEGMKNDLVQNFGKITRHFGEAFDKERLEKVMYQVSKLEVKRKTGHDPQVVQLRNAYERDRRQFRSEHSNLVWDVLLKKRPLLNRSFPNI